MSRSPDDFSKCYQAMAVMIARDKASDAESAFERKYFAVRAFTVDEIRSLDHKYRALKRKRNDLSLQYARLRAHLSVRDQLIVDGIWRKYGNPA